MWLATEHEESLLRDAVLEKTDFVVSLQPDYAAAQAPLQFQHYCLFSLHTTKAQQNTPQAEAASPGKSTAALEVAFAQPLYPFGSIYQFSTGILENFKWLSLIHWKR